MFAHSISLYRPSTKWTNDLNSKQAGRQPVSHTQMDRQRWENFVTHTHTVCRIVSYRVVIVVCTMAPIWNGTYTYMNEHISCETPCNTSSSGSSSSHSQVHISLDSSVDNIVIIACARIAHSHYTRATQEQLLLSSLRQFFYNFFIWNVFFLSTLLLIILLLLSALSMPSLLPFAVVVFTHLIVYVWKWQELK